MSRGGDVDCPVYVVLPSSGTGERFGAPLPKQYQLLDGVPLFLHTISAFHRLPYVKVIVMTISKDRGEYVQSLLDRCNYHKVRIAVGGSTRHRSIYNGLKALKGVCGPSDVVLIHDVVRIFADNDVVSAVAMAAKETGAAGVSRPLTSTVIGVDAAGYLTESLDRSKFKASEMPQGFIYSTITGAYVKATEYDFEFGTECLHLAQKYMGSRVKVVEGPSSLWKVTYRKDFAAAEAMIKDRYVTVFSGEGPDDFKQNLKEKLQEKNIKVMTKTATIKDSEEAANFIHLYMNSLCSCMHVFNDQTLKNLKQEMLQNCLKADKNDSDTESRKEVTMEDATTNQGFPNKAHVHVRFCTTEEIQCKEYFDLVTQFQKSAEAERKIQGSLHYLILVHTGADVTVAIDIIVSLIKGRESCLNGQVFNVM